MSYMCISIPVTVARVRHITAVVPNRRQAAANGQRPNNYVAGSSELRQRRQNRVKSNCISVIHRVLLGNRWFKSKLSGRRNNGDNGKYGGTASIQQVDCWLYQKRVRNHGNRIFSSFTEEDNLAGAEGQVYKHNLQSSGIRTLSFTPFHPLTTLFFGLIPP